MKMLCLMICVCGLILSGVGTATADSWQVVYQTDFSSDPGWTTDQPQNFYWVAASGTYFIHQTNYPEAYEPDRYTFMQVPYYGGPFRLEWDLEMLRSDWSAGINIGLFDSNLSYLPGPITGSASINVEYVNPDQGRGFNIWAFQDTTYASSVNWTRFDLNVWYHNVFEYDPDSATAKWTVYKLGESTPFMEETLTDVPAITNNISYLGASRYPVLHPWGGGVNPNGIAEARIDNVVLSSPEPAEPLTGRIAFYTTDPYRLSVMNADGTCRYVLPLPYDQLPIVAGPQWSADGSWLTFSGGPVFHSQIYIVRPDGSDFCRVTNGSGDLVMPGFSPDGSKIAYHQVYGHLYTIDAICNAPPPLDHGINGGHTRWSPDGRYIAYTNWGFTYQSDIFLYDLITDDSNQITHHDPGEAFNYAAWSPDGNRLAVSYQDATGQWDIMIMDSNGSEPRNLTSDWSTSNESWPSWSPDGQYIVFTSDRSGNLDIWYSPVDVFAPVNITNSPEDEYIPAIGVPEPVRTYHVDGATGDNTNDGLTPETAFATIQRGINIAEDYDTVLVWPGVYNEEIGFWGDAITVKSAADAAVVETDYGYAFSFFSAEGPDTVLSNFVIRNSQFGIYLVNGSSPTLSNLTIVNNDFGISAFNGADPDISNCIFWDNNDGDLFRDPVPLEAKYSWIQEEVNEPNMPLAGPISHWKLDEGSGTTAYDSAGSNDGTIYGAVPATGQVGGALEFDGVDDYVDCGTSFASVTASTTKSIIAWVKSADGMGANILILYRKSDSGTCFSITAESTPVVWKGSYMKSATTVGLLDSESPVVVNKWTHIALVQDGTNVDIYVNGVSENNSSDAAAPTISNPLNATIGTYFYGGPTCFFNGTIDDVRIYDRALSAEEIQAIYEAGLAGHEYGPLPLFADANNGDYHLLSERGRYWPAHDVWVLDEVTSPCVDGGDPAVDPSGERMPNGGRINMGAYGNTAYASMSEWPIKGDINRDGRFNFVDVALLCDEWLAELPWAQ